MVTKNERYCRNEAELLDFRNEYENSPYWITMGITFDQLTQEQARIKIPLQTAHLNMNGTIHGGVIVSILDAVMGVTLRHQIYKSKVATMSLTTQFIKPTFDGSTVFATANVIHAGKRVASMEGKIINENDEIVASGVSTFMINRNVD